MPIEPAAGWTNRGPYGGAVYNVAADPQNPAAAYAGTAHGLYRSTDSGAHWAKMPLEFEKAFVVPDLSNSSVLFVETAVYQYTLNRDILFLLRSTDSGQTWTTVLSSLNGLSLAFDPVHPGTIYAAGAFNQLDLLKSTDNGTTWSALPLSTGDLIGVVESVAVDPSTPTTLFVAALLFADNSFALFKSTDAGASWASTGFRTPTPLALTVDAFRPATVYAETTRLYRSDDGGISWRDRTPVAPPDQAVAFTVDPVVPGRIYLATATHAVFSSYDRGTTWMKIGQLPGFVSSLSASTSREVYAATNDRGIFVLSAGGDGWVSRNDGILAASVSAVAIAPSDPQTAYALASGFARTTDGGQTWAVDTFAPTADIGALAIDPSNPSVVYASGAGGGILRSADGGETWRTILSDTAAVVSIAIDPKDPATLYAADGSLRKSTNGGETWNLIRDGFGSLVRLVAVDSGGSGTIFAADFELHRSEDGGESWSVVLPQPVFGIATASAFPGTVYAATGPPILKSLDNGSTWLTTTPFESDLNEVSAISSSADGVVYVLAYSLGYHGFVWGGTPLVSADGGASWRTIRGWNQQGVPVNCLGLDASGFQLLLGTDRGIWQIDSRVPRVIPSRPFGEAPSHSAPER
jgi:photosystem II stability/assembly factor-like uncharacterized protein